MVTVHISRSLTAVLWLNQKHKPRSASPLLAATSSTGAVLAWDAALGELRWRTDAAHAGAAEALAFGPAGGVLYSGGADGQVCQMEAASGTVLAKDRLERHGIAALAVSPGERGHNNMRCAAFWEQVSAECRLWPSAA
jgi:U3 small nucleolar RNA-associated protein 5